MRITADEMMLAMTGVSEQLITESLSESKTLRERALTRVLTAAASLLLVVGVMVFAAARGWNNHVGGSPVGGSGTEGESENETSDTAQETEYGTQNGVDAENQPSLELIKKYFLCLERQDAEGLYDLMVKVTNIGSRYTKMISDKESRDALDGIYNYKTASISEMKLIDVLEDKTNLTWIDNGKIYDLTDKGERIEVWTVEANVETYRPSRFIKEGKTVYIFYIIEAKDGSRSIVWVRSVKDGEDIGAAALDGVPTRNDELTERITLNGHTFSITTLFDGVGILNIEVGGEGFEVTRVSGTDKFCIEGGGETLLYYDAADGRIVDLKNEVPERDAMEKLGIEIGIVPMGVLVYSDCSRYIYYYSFKEERYINLASKLGIGSDEAACVRLLNAERTVQAEVYRPNGNAARSGEFVEEYEFNLISGELKRINTGVYGEPVSYRHIELDDGTEYSVVFSKKNGKIAEVRVICSSEPVKYRVYNGSEIVIIPNEGGPICALLTDAADEDAAVEVIEDMDVANGVWESYKQFPIELDKYLQSMEVGAANGEGNIAVTDSSLLFIGDRVFKILELYDFDAHEMSSEYRPESIDGVRFLYSDTSDGIFVAWRSNGEDAYRAVNLADAYASGDITKEELTWIARIWSCRD